MKHSTQSFLFGVGLLFATVIGQWMVIARIASGGTQRFVGAALLLSVCSCLGAFVLGGVYHTYVEE